MASDPSDQFSSVPKDGPSIDLELFIRTKSIDLSPFVSNLRFQAMVNGGYIVEFELYDASYNIHRRLKREELFTAFRGEPIFVDFRIRHSRLDTPPKNATKKHRAILVSKTTYGEVADNATIYITAVDPPTWRLTRGKAQGNAYKGRVSDVIRDVARENEVSIVITETVDSKQNIWYPMRQDPLSFICSLLEWSSAITPKKTDWLVAAESVYENGRPTDTLYVEEQAAKTSQQRGFYRYAAGATHTNIIDWEVLMDGAMNILHQGFTAQGADSTTGKYLDKTADDIATAQGRAKANMVVTDGNTPNKFIARTTDRPILNTTLGELRQDGLTSFASTPEIYSAGDLGVDYKEYIAGRARGLWLRMVNNLIRARFRVIGDGEWSGASGLGRDTIFIKWVPGRPDPRADDEVQFFVDEEEWWLTGNWLVYGYKHYVDDSQWYTDLYCCRYDFNSESQKVPAQI